jgi:hypothetical protein
MCGTTRSLADFLKELPVICKRAEISLSQYLGPDDSLERRLRLPELQLSYVYTTVLAKKCRVRLPCLVSRCWSKPFVVVRRLSYCIFGASVDVDLCVDRSIEDRPCSDYL